MFFRALTDLTFSSSFGPKASWGHGAWVAGAFDFHELGTVKKKKKKKGRPYMYTFHGGGRKDKNAKKEY